MSGNETRNQGLALEQLLYLLHEKYQTHNKGHIWHAGTVAEFHHRRWIPKKSLPDYQGVLAGGQFVSFDAKSISPGCQSYHHPKNRMHQAQHLYTAGRMGGLVFLLLVEPEAGWMAFPSPAWHEDHGFTIHLEPGPLVVPVPGVSWSAEYIPDWLEAIERSGLAW